MNKKFFFTILFFCQNLLIYADDCSVFSCSQLSTETNQKCSFTGGTCKSYYTSCQGLNEGGCTATVQVFPLNKKCNWDNGVCQTVNRLCSEYSGTAPSDGLTCESLEASAGKYCITLTDGKCAEESGCPTDKTDCVNHKPLDSEHKWDHTRLCKEVGESCSSEPKLCGDFENNGDVCEKLSTSDNTKKKCFPTNVAPNCVEQFTKCEYYSGTTESECTAISSYIPEPDNYKCVFDTTCKTKKKECSDFDNEPTNCGKYTPENTSKRCVHTTINSEPKCIEVFKTCSDYSNSQEAKNSTFCEAIVEDLYHKCNYVSSSSTCVSKQNKCEDYSSEATCNTIQVNDTYKCKFDNGECIEVRQYKDCNLYTGKDRSICETITPPESNKRCILKNDEQCVSVPKECENYIGTGLNEYECINNYKPLDESYKCIFKNNACIKTFKYKYCSDYLGEESTICSNIEPTINDESYSIKCEMNDVHKCVRVEKGCSSGNSKSAEECSSIVPKNSKKKCILKGSTCDEEYKTCKDYNDDINEETISQSICEGITSNDGKKCKYTAPTSPQTRGTCTEDSTNKYKCDASFDITTFKNACISIKLNDISKQCVYDKGECTMESKTCLELTFNGNENGIEDICKSAEASETKKCILSPEKTHCIEVDNSLVIDENSNNNGGNGDNGDNGSNGGNENNNNQQENNSNFGKVIYLNILFVIILFLLF